MRLFRRFHSIEINATGYSIAIYVSATVTPECHAAFISCFVIFRLPIVQRKKKKKKKNN